MKLDLFEGMLDHAKSGARSVRSQALGRAAGELHGRPVVARKEIP